ncbi:MAG TPA: hypothetical protein VFW35_12685 [Sphingomicrobium sp.]|nr:hypothetical protein [Sphingomicrobium sp.]
MAALGIDRAAVLPSLIRQLGIGGLAGIALIIFQELIPRAVKETLIFWRLRDRAPGHRAFSKIAKRDPRVDPTELAVLLPTHPMSGAEQNSLWYRWLKSVESDPAIADNHHRLLALRESSVLLVLLGVTSLVGGPFLFGSLRKVLLLAVPCFGFYVLTAIAARNAANRLVGNVIARKVATS